MEKFELRNQVRNAVETMLTFGETKVIIINNLMLWINGFNKIEEDDCIHQDLFGVDFELRKEINGKMELMDRFWVQKYAKNHWGMITEPWVCDLITDITSSVEKHIEEPKKRGW